MLILCRESAAYYAVFDGHAGARAAQYCADHMHVTLASKLSRAFASGASLAQLEKDMRRYFLETFKQCDDEFLKAAAKR
jgi:serine/threonine protein phosphatase PrpC